MVFVLLLCNFLIECLRDMRSSLMSLGKRSFSLVMSASARLMCGVKGCRLLCLFMLFEHVKVGKGGDCYCGECDEIGSWLMFCGFVCDE